MTKLNSILILLLLALALVPMYYGQKILQKKLEPRRSLLRLLMYMLTVLLIVFAYSFLLVWCAGKLIPHA